MKDLRAAQKMIFIGIVALLFIGCAKAQYTPLIPARDYWPTEGWRESNPERQDMDSQVLAKIKPYIEKDLPQIRSVLIVRHGYLVYEQYFQYFNRNYKQGVASVTKSISSALVGVALKEGYLKNLDQRLEICEELKKLLPKSKHKLLEKYSNLYAMETDSILEAAIIYIIQNENEISEALVNY